MGCVGIRPPAAPAESGRDSAAHPEVYDRRLPGDPSVMGKKPAHLLCTNPGNVVVCDETAPPGCSACSAATWAAAIPLALVGGVIAGACYLAVGYLLVNHVVEPPSVHRA